MAKNIEEKRSVRVTGVDVPYFIKFNEGQKNLILKVKTGEIHISAPFYTPEYQIELMIQKHYSKIQKLQTNFEMNNKYDLYTSNPWIKIFDKKVAIHIVDQNINTKADVNGFHMKNYFNNEIQLKKLYTYIARYYKNWFIDRTLFWAEKMGLTFKSINIKTMTAKWGACYTNEEKIIYNTKLLHFKKETIDSVIVHELSHLVHPNHSRRFWDLVHSTFPTYKEQSDVLNSAGI